MPEKLTIALGGVSMSKNELTRILSNAEVFTGLTGDDLWQISDLCKTLSFNTGDIIIKEGQAGSAFYIVVSGELEVVLPKKMLERNLTRVSKVELNVLKKGHCFGEYSLIDKGSASASVIAMNSGELIKITENDFNEKLMADHRIAKTFYRNLLRMLIRRLRKREKEYDLISLFVLPSG